MRKGYSLEQIEELFKLSHFMIDKEDRYFNGNPWIITTIALYHYWNKTNRPLTGLIDFLQFLKDKKMDLHEQIERTSGEGVSVNRLTWNYAELITLMSNIQFGSLFLL